MRRTMRKILFVLMVVSLLFFVYGPTAQSQNVTEEKKAADETAKPQNVGNTICPVSGEKVGSGGMTPATYEYEGKVYNFCCPGCIEEFKKDPKKYQAIVEKELKGRCSEEQISAGQCAGVSVPTLESKSQMMIHDMPHK